MVKLPEDSADLQQTYRTRFAGLEEGRRTVWKVLNRHYFSRWIRPSDTVVDVGAGYCEFINSVHAAVRYALDLNPSTKEKAAEGVRVITQDINREWQLPTGCADVVFTSNFFEHLRSKDELTHCLSEIGRILRGGGRLIAMGPNIRFCYNLYWDFFDHFLPLSDRSLAEAVSLAGMNPEVVISRFLPYTMVRHRYRSRAALVWIYLHLPLAWRFAGKQFLIVARKLD